MKFEHKKKTYDVGNLDPGLRQAQKYGMLYNLICISFCIWIVEYFWVFLFYLFSKTALHCKLILYYHY